MNRERLASELVKIAKELIGRVPFHDLDDGNKITAIGRKLGGYTIDKTISPMSMFGDKGMTWTLINKKDNLEVHISFEKGGKVWVAVIPFRDMSSGPPIASDYVKANNINVLAREIKKMLV